MSKPRIHIQIDKKGDTRILDITGAGSGCQSVTSDLEKTLGLVDEQTRETTMAMYEKNDPIRINNEV